MVRVLPVATAFARGLRKRSTLAERVLWGALRGRRFIGWKFRRQQSIGPFFVDFICHEASLAIELDGASHRGREEADARRDAWLRDLDVMVIRFANDDVLVDLDAVLETISTKLKNQSATSPLSPRERGRG